MVIDESSRANLPMLMPDGSEKCFHCHTPVALPYIYWNGSGYGDESLSLALHPACALEFTVRLMRDVHALELAGVRVTLSPKP